MNPPSYPLDSRAPHLEAHLWYQEKGRVGSDKNRGNYLDMFQASNSTACGHHSTQPSDRLKHHFHTPRVLPCCIRAIKGYFPLTAVDTEYLGTTMFVSDVPNSSSTSDATDAAKSTTHCKAHNNGSASSKPRVRCRTIDSFIGEQLSNSEEQKQGSAIGQRGTQQ